MNNHEIKIKVSEIIQELKKNGDWKKAPPAWVNNFGKLKITPEQDFAGWLQFVYLPNIQMDRTLIQAEANYVAPQAIRYFGDDIKKGKLLELLIELDAITGMN